MLHKIEHKIARLRYYIDLLKSYRSECEERFGKDPLYEGAVLHYLYLVSDGSIALAEMVLRLKKCGRSQSYFEAIDRLGECGVLPPEFAYEFAKIASFRNFLAHDYEKIDAKKICKEALQKLEQIEEYIGYVEQATGLAS